MTEPTLPEEIEKLLLTLEAEGRPWLAAELHAAITAALQAERERCATLVEQRCFEQETPAFIAQCIRAIAALEEINRRGTTSAGEAWTRDAQIARRALTPEGK